MIPDDSLPQEFELWIPGTPHAQGRPRATTVGRHARMYEDKRDTTAKGYVRDAALRKLEPLERKLPYHAPGPLAVDIQCVFPCPKYLHRKTKPQEEAWMVTTQRYDVDNLAKLYMDALNEVLWKDDGQVSKLVVERIVAHQDGAPYTYIWSRPLTDAVRLIVPPSAA